MSKEKENAQQEETAKRKEAVRIGGKLKSLRESEALSQEAMGTLIGITGAAWRMYELGLRIPNDEVKKRIAVRSGKTVDELFF